MLPEQLLKATAHAVNGLVYAHTSIRDQLHDYMSRYCQKECMAEVTGDCIGKAAANMTPLLTNLEKRECFLQSHLRDETQK